MAVMKGVQPMIGDLIQGRLAEKGWSQTQLAVNAQLSQAYISKLLRGQVKLPTQETLKKIGTQLDISLSEFYAAAGILVDAEADALSGDENPILADLVPYVQTWTGLASRLRAIREADSDRYEALMALLRAGLRAHAEQTIALYELLA